LLLGCTPEDTGFEPWVEGHTDFGASESTSTAGTATSSTSSEGLGPPYPLVLAHGFFGFDDFAGLDFIDYFWRVQEALEAEGHTVYTPAVDPYNDSFVRGAQLTDAVEAILAETGAERVNLVGHSQGGLDARVVAHLHPEWVASVTTFATPHGGTAIGDVALAAVPGEAQDVIDWLLQTFGMVAYDDFGNETSLFAALWQYSQPGINAFNAEYTDQPGVDYFSVTGRTDGHDGGTDCEVPGAPAFIADFEDETDPVDPILWLSEIVLDGGIGDPLPNDGLLQVRNAKWGTFLGCVPADHLDEIGQVIGDEPGFGNTWDYITFYVDLAAFIRARGH